jgi:hypothetical protein
LAQEIRQSHFPSAREAIAVKASFVSNVSRSARSAFRQLVIVYSCSRSSSHSTLGESLRLGSRPLDLRASLGVNPIAMINCQSAANRAHQRRLQLHRSPAKAVTFFCAPNTALKLLAQRIARNHGT